MYYYLYYIDIYLLYYAIFLFIVYYLSLFTHSHIISNRFCSTENISAYEFGVTVNDRIHFIPLKIYVQPSQSSISVEFMS